MTTRRGRASPLRERHQLTHAVNLAPRLRNRHRQMAPSESERVVHDDDIVVPVRQSQPTCGIRQRCRYRYLRTQSSAPHPSRAETTLHSRHARNLRRVLPRVEFLHRKLTRLQQRLRVLRHRPLERDLIAESPTTRPVYENTRARCHPRAIANVRSSHSFGPIDRARGRRRFLMRGARGAPSIVALSLKSPIIHSRASRASSPRPSARSSRVRIDRLASRASFPRHRSTSRAPFPRLLRRGDRSPRWASVVARARLGTDAPTRRSRGREPEAAASASRSSSSRAFVRSSRVDVRRLSGSIGGGAVRRRRRRDISDSV